MRVLQERQVRERVLDLGAVVEAHAADDLVAQLALAQHVLDRPRLRVGAVEDGDLAERHPLVGQPLDLPHDEPRLGTLVVELADLDRIALAEVGPQVFAEPAAVVADDGVGGIENRLRRAVVLLEPDDLRVFEVVLELEDVSDVGASEAVDRVVRHEPAGDEVVRPFDVDVVDG